MPAPPPSLGPVRAGGRGLPALLALLAAGPAWLRGGTYADWMHPWLWLAAAVLAVVLYQNRAPEHRARLLRDPVAWLGLLFIGLLALQWANAGRALFFDTEAGRWTHSQPPRPGWPFAFTSGEVDLMYAKREQRWVDSARKRPGFNVEIFRPGEYRLLHINQSVPPLDDIRVRRAIAAAVNTDDLVRYVGKDVGPKGCSVVPPGYLGEDCSVRYAFDLAKAKALLAEAGHKDGITVKAIVSNISAQQPIMEIIQAQLAKAGIKLDMQVVDHATYQSQTRKDLSGVVFYGAARFPIADTYLSEFFHSRATVNTPTAATNFSHCKVGDKEIEQARTASDAEAQKALWKEAQRKIMEDVCAIPLFELRQVWARSDRLDFGYELKGSMNLAPAITEATTLKAR